MTVQGHKARTVGSLNSQGILRSTGKCLLLLQVRRQSMANGKG
jgi:hypothetical protein